VAAEALLVGASVVSLVGVGFGLLKAAHSAGLAQAGPTALTALTVVLSCAVVQCVYTLRDAHLSNVAPRSLVRATMSVMGPFGCPRRASR